MNMVKNRHTVLDEDADLVIAWLQGEVSAFEELVRKHQKRIFNLAYRYMGNYEDACEVTQEAFVAAFRGRDTLRGAARFSIWLTGITVKHSRDRLRKTVAGRDNRPFPSEVQSPVGDGGVPREVSASSPEQLEWHDLSGKIQGCINSLDADTREMTILRDVQGFSYDDICEILSIREGTVKSRLTRARELVRDCLKRTAGAN
jgi:RNA polymerase sigma-70 factor, ECF subfamily